MIIKSKDDAEVLINEIEVAKAISRVERATINFGSVYISRHDDKWLGHDNCNVMNLCFSYDSIVNFVWKNRKSINESQRASGSVENIPLCTFREYIDISIRNLPNNIKDEIVMKMGQLKKLKTI